MSIIKIGKDIELPYDEIAILSGDPQRLADYLRELVKVNEEYLKDIVSATNLGIDLVSGDAVYYALKDKDGNYPVYTWRRLQVGDNLEDQILTGGDSTSGTWTTVYTRERPE